MPNWSIHQPAVEIENLELAETEVEARTSNHSAKEAPLQAAAPKKTIIWLALLVSLRMLGLFMAMPVMSVYGQGLSGATQMLLGVSVGVYGLTQALLQIPFGWLSDRWGRKPIIFGGLCLFVLGSLIAATSTHVLGLIVGRAIQGAGAIAATVMALLSDLTPESQRTKAMAVVGASIGMSFVLALLVGPILASWLGLSGLFYVTAVLGLLGMLICLWCVPSASQNSRASPAQVLRLSGLLGALRTTLGKKALLGFDMGVFMLHATMTAFFVVVPQHLVAGFGWDVAEHWKVYVPLLFVSLVFMVPLVILTEKRKMANQTLLAMIALLWVSQLFMAYFALAWFGFVIAMLVYFVGFNTLEALLPSMLSKQVPASERGISMGVYSSFQFLGAFFGGWFAGVLLTYMDVAAVHLGLAGSLLVWFIWALRRSARPASLAVTTDARLD